MLYAERALIGKLEPSLWSPPEAYEWYRVTPKGVGIQVFCSGVQDLSRDLAMAQARTAAGVAKLAEEGVDVITIGGIPVLGHGYKRYAATLDFLQAIQATTPIPLVTSLTTTVDSLKALGIKRLVAATPYSEELDQNHRDLLEDCGFEVLVIKGLRLVRTGDIFRLPEESSYQLAREVYAEAPQAEAIFIFCPGWPVVGNIAKLEAECGCAVLSSVTTQLWACLKAIGWTEPVPGYGRLLEELPACPAW